MTVKTIFLDCWRRGKLIASHEYGLATGMLPGTSMDKDTLIDQSKSQLTTDELAFPPYDGITFSVRYL